MVSLSLEKDCKFHQSKQFLFFLQLSSLSVLSGIKGLPIKAPDELGAIPITEMTKPAAVVLDDQGNAIDQATGRVITITQRMPSLKVNIREKKKEQMKNNELIMPEKTEQENKHYDPRMKYENIFLKFLAQVKQEESKTVQPLFKDLSPGFNKIYENKLYCVKVIFFFKLQ